MLKKNKKEVEQQEEILNVETTEQPMVQETEKVDAKLALNHGEKKFFILTEVGGADEKDVHYKVTEVFFYKDTNDAKKKIEEYGKSYNFTNLDDALRTLDIWRD